MKVKARPQTRAVAKRVCAACGSRKSTGISSLLRKRKKRTRTELESRRVRATEKVEGEGREPVHRIVNGTAVTADERGVMPFPFFAMLTVHGNNAQSERFTCGGSVIEERTLENGDGLIWILSAAHCVHEREDKIGVRVYVGGQSTGSRVMRGGNYWIDKPPHSVTVYKHPAYDDVRIDNDIALLRAHLTKNEMKKLSKLKKESTGPTVAVPNRITNVQNEPATLVGFGSESIETQASTYLETGRVTVENSDVDATSVTQVAYNPVTETNAIGDVVEGPNATTPGSRVEACLGDSGGPLLRRGTNEIIGLVSYGFAECAEYPGVYTRISAFADNDPTGRVPKDDVWYGGIAGVMQRVTEDIVASEGSDDSESDSGIASHPPAPAPAPSPAAGDNSSPVPDVSASEPSLSTSFRSIVRLFGGR